MGTTEMTHEELGEDHDTFWGAKGIAKKLLVAMPLLLVASLLLVNW